VKEKQPTSAQHMWKLLQECWKSIPGESGWENAKSVQSYFEESKIYLDLFDTFLDTTWFHVTFHSFDVFTIISLRHYFLWQESSLQSLVWIQAVSQPAVIGSPIGQRIIGPASSGFGRGRPSLWIRICS
jgi:hypothetical protein